MHNVPSQLPLTPPPSPPADKQCLGSFAPVAPASRLGRYLGQSLQLQTILGTGAYGVVYEAFDHCTRTRYAVKALSKTSANGVPLDRRQREFQQREIQLHYAASAHPNIVSMLKIVDDADCTYVILEHCPEGDLFSNITEKGRYVSNEELVREVFLQILDAVEHCHRLGIYHRDLKPENILVSGRGAKVLLADFGLATMDAQSGDHGCGSTFYMSEECLDQRARNLPYLCAPNDVWSLGVILVNLTCGRNPWKQASSEDPTYRSYLKDRDFLKSILPLSAELNELLGMIFERDPKRRISIGQLKCRVKALRSFCTPPTAALPTPPPSPCTSIHPDLRDVNKGVLVVESTSDAETAVDDCSDVPSDGASDYSSEDSDVSDESDEDYDSGYDSPIEQEYERMPAPKVTKPAPIKPQYVLPSQNAHTPWFAAPKTPWPPCSTFADPYHDGFHSGYAGGFASALGVYQGFHPSPFQFASHCY